MPASNVEVPASLAIDVNRCASLGNSADNDDPRLPLTGARLDLSYESARDHGRTENV